MSRRIYDADTLKYITLFESLTGAKVRDFVAGDHVLVVVEKGDMGLAIGRHGFNLRRMEQVLKRDIKVVEFDDDAVKFIKNYIYPIKNIEISREDSIIRIKGENKKTNGMLIGRDRVNLKRMTSIVKRFFDIKDIMVV